MRLLLDTHALIWALSDPDRLSERARAAVEDGTNDVLVSAASVWEIAIKRQLGKLRLPGPLGTALEEASLDTLTITVEHAETVGTLPLHHRDPFDRMLIAQATVETLTIVTRDPSFGPYGVRLLAA